MKQKIKSEVLEEIKKEKESDKSHLWMDYPLKIEVVIDRVINKTAEAIFKLIERNNVSRDREVIKIMFRKIYWKKLKKEWVGKSGKE